MIYTITLNPSVDYIVQLDNLKTGLVNTVDQETKIAGGKGVNVTRVLKRLGHQSTALGFVGGFTGQFIEKSLNDEELSTKFIHVEGDTRINIKLKNSEETEINGLSPSISEDYVDKLFEQLSQTVPGDLVVMAGSVPASINQSIYSRILHSLPDGVQAIVDTKGKALEETLKAKPFLVKPNHHELGDLFGVTVTTVDDAVKYGKKVQAMGAENVIVSMAGNGAVLITQEDILFGNVPVGHVKNSVGAGDSVVAGFLSTYIETGDLKEAFQSGIAAGSASAFSSGFCTEEEVQTLRKKISVKPYDNGGGQR
ncbi:1-phosphofructokinase [Guptibacillus hwajinpoensis]|uniref:Tagatose-6-phosphate kinase n=1 Tax=Guptibacillus hwajinpoensis TaxID=208199 RepID=A0A0J6CM99_9BACL|nr:1-phosphofructokinase [Alkalihalobacillus macyae]KMM37346.1 phosphofructokinase [Alkalihalobacillus macyae]